MPSFTITEVTEAKIVANDADDALAIWLKQDFDAIGTFEVTERTIVDDEGASHYPAGV